MTSILIIEDDTQISRLINSTLTVEGITVKVRWMDRRGQTVLRETI